MAVKVVDVGLAGWLAGRLAVIYRLSLYGL